MLWLLGLGLVAAVGVAAAASSGSSSNPTLAGADPVLGGVVAQIMARAERFTKTIDASAANPAAPDFAKLAGEAQARKAAEEAAARKYINDTFDKYRDGAVLAATTTGIGVVAVPFIIIAAQLGKWAANAQITMFKAMGVAVDGWSETWQANLAAELQWLAAVGIPFPSWNNGKGWNSPMGYVNGGGGSECGHGGLCSIREAYGKFLGPLERKSAFAAWESMRRHLTDNPIVLAYYTRAGAVDGGFVVTVGGDDADRRLFVGALASAVCQDMGVPFERWRDVMARTHKEFSRLFDAHSKRGANFPLAESVGSTFDYAQTIAGQAGGLLVLRGLKLS